jgi:hypothetical protein
MAAYNASGFFGSFSTDATHAATWTQGVIRYEQWKLERKLPMLVLGPKKIDVAACNAWSKKGSFSTDATHAATWTQGVIKYEQWKLERKLPMLVLFRRFSKMLVLFGSFSMWSRISHFSYLVILSLFSS